MITRCRNCGVLINTKLGGLPPGTIDSEGRRSPGDWDNVCDVCCYGEGVRGSVLEESDIVERNYTIDVSGEEVYAHTAGDKFCTEGWCQGSLGEFPKPCSCGGLIHADFGDENYDGYWLHTKCDVCGEPE